VTAKMEREFCDITPEKSTLSGTKPGMAPTLLRSLLVQSHSLNEFGVQPSDVVIEPDVTTFDLTEFMRA
jgi:NTE family protein